MPAGPRAGLSPPPYVYVLSQAVFFQGLAADPGSEENAMRQLPERPNLDQLRRQARELQRRSKPVTLSAAQLALARDYGFPSWARMKAEVERRRAPHPALPQRGERPAVELRTWPGM